MALAQGAAGQLEEARDTIDEVLALLPPEPVAARSPLIGAAATIEGMLGQIAEMRRRVLSALERMPPEESALLELTMAGSQYYTVDFEAMREWAARAVAHSRAGEPTVRAAAEAMGGLATLLLGEPDAAHPMIDSALARLAALDDATLATRLDHPYLVAAAALLANRTSDGLMTVTRAMSLARGTRQDRMIPMLAVLRCMLLENELRLDEAMEEAETAVEGARLLATDGQLHPALMIQSQIHFLRGDRAQAARVAEESVEIALRPEPSTATVTTLCNAASLWVEEDPERCIRERTGAAGPMLERVDQSWSTWLLAHLVHAALALGRLDDAERWTRLIEERAELTRVPGVRARAARARAGVLVAQGEPAKAAALAQAAADAADLADARLDGVPARLAAGRALAAAGEREQAVAQLQQAAADAGRGGAGLFVEAAARELRRLGSRLSASSRRAGTRAGTASGDELTGREREIAELVAEGRSNKQVAAALFLSEKTIEHHLSRIYAKLGVRSRGELAARMPR
jgi:ATP/maltotriose-dependent transcriptional regulator MalT